MRYVPPIDIDDLASLSEIAVSLNADTKPAVSAVRERLEDAYALFDKKIPNLHKIIPEKLPKKARPALEKVFRRRLGKFRSVWEALITHFDEMDESTCPYCNVGEQWEYDHYLPKSVFPEFTLYPPNLVPICKPCNGKKASRYEEDGERLFTYAFSELNGIDGLLEVSVSYGTKPRVAYSLVNPGTLTAKTFTVLERHFEALALGKRYAKQASSTVARLRRRFRTKASLALGRRRLGGRLRQMADDRALLSPPNHWEVALLQHLAATSEFVDHVSEILE